MAQQSPIAYETYTRIPKRIHHLLRYMNGTKDAEVKFFTMKKLQALKALTGPVVAVKLCAGEPLFLLDFDDAECWRVDLCCRIWVVGKNNSHTFKTSADMVAAVNQKLREFDIRDEEFTEEECVVNLRKIHRAGMTVRHLTWGPLPWLVTNE